MSEIKVNNIQGLEGTHGPVVSGITTMASSGAMSLPRGDTAYRGGRGRGIFGGGRTPTPGSRTNLVDYITIASTGNAIDFGDLINALEHLVVVHHQLVVFSWVEVDISNFSCNYIMLQYLNWKYI